MSRQQSIRQHKLFATCAIMQKCEDMVNVVQEKLFLACFVWLNNQMYAGSRGQAIIAVRATELYMHTAQLGMLLRSHTASDLDHIGLMAVPQLITAGRLREARVVHCNWHFRGSGTLAAQTCPRVVRCAHAESCAGACCCPLPHLHDSMQASWVFWLLPIG